VPLEAIVAAERAGTISFAYYDQLHAPIGTPSGRTYGDLLASVGPDRVALLRRWFGAVGVAEPPTDVALDLVDEEFLRAQAEILGDLATPAFALRIARVQGFAARRVADAALSTYAEAVAELPVEAGGLPLEETWATHLEPWTRLARLAPTTSRWLQARHLSSAIDAYSVSETERYLEQSGFVPERVDEPAAVAFIDIAGFTRLSDERGDAVAAAIASDFGELAGRIASDHGGVVVKLLGDGALVRFWRAGAAKAAVDASLELLASMLVAGLPPGHAGVAVGPVVIRDGDVFGRTVNLASRIGEDVATAGRLLATTSVADSLPRDAYEVVAYGPASLRGIAEPVELVEVRRA
jgi:class 3 adenylate cyclase